MDTPTRLHEAHEAAQIAFRAMLNARAYSDPDAPETRAYVAAERLVDSILVDAQWEKAKAELDRLQAIDIEELAKGDHFAGMPPAGFVSGELDEFDRVYEGMDF